MIAVAEQARASMEDWKVRLTMAATMTTLPRRQGRRKCTVSTLAVTTGPRATVLAARPAQMSIQLSTWGASALGWGDRDGVRGVCAGGHVMHATVLAAGSCVVKQAQHPY